MKKLALALLILGCGSSEPNEWSATTANAVIQVCREGSSLSYCQCFLDGLRDYYTEEEFLDLTQDIVDGAPLPNELFDIRDSCN